MIFFACLVSKAVRHCRGCKAWPRAYEYTDEDVGVGTLTGYWRYPEAFLQGRWIWSVNLVFDNVVIMRKTVK